MEGTLRVFAEERVAKPRARRNGEAILTDKVLSEYKRRDQ
jgi:hypothetical protein